MTLPLGALLNAEYPVSELIELGRRSESLGYDQLWYTDVRLFRECYVGLAALATHTERIRLGPGVTDPYSRHPAVTAAATNKKRGFSFPMNRWMQSSIGELQEIAAAARLDRGTMRQCWNQFARGELHWSRAWVLTVLGAQN